MAGHHKWIDCKAEDDAEHKEDKNKYADNFQFMTRLRVENEPIEVINSKKLGKYHFQVFNLGSSHGQA